MTALTAGELTLLRADGHKAKLYLSVSKPTALLAARVNGTFNRAERSIDYDGGADSGYATVGYWNPCLVGSSAGAKDKGVARVRSLTGDQTSGTLVLAENSIDWADNDYLTVLHDYPLWPAYPWMGGTPVVWKKDGPDGLEYTDENELPPPVPIMGPHRAGWLVAGSCSFYLDATDSYLVRAGSIDDYTWECDGGVIDDADAAQTFITFTSAGQYWLKLTVTDDDGKTQFGYRRIFVHSTASPPYTAFSLDSLSGDWERGGWSARFTVRGAATATDFPDGALVVLWQEATYGTTAGNIGGYKLNNADSRNVLFAGYIRGESISQNWNTGEMAFEASTVEALLKRHQMFSISLQHVTGTQGEWWEYTSPTVAQALHHLWKWHSNLLVVADVHLPTANTLKLSRVDLERGDLYGMADMFARQYGIFAHVACSKWGAVHVETDIQLLSTAERAAKAVILDITKPDRREAISITRQIETPVGMVHLSGIAFDGAKGTPYIARAPGDAPADVGAQTVDVERQVLSSQAQANTLAGRVLAAENNAYREVRIAMRGHYLGAFDIVPQEWATLSLASGDTTRGIVWSAKNLVARNVSAQYDPAAGSILTDVVFEAEAEGADGVTGDYPTEEPDPGPDPGTPVQPPVLIPPPVGALSAYSSANGHFWRAAAGGSFAARNGGLSGANIQDTFGRTDPFWFTAGKQNTSDAEKSILWKLDVGKVYRSADAGVTWVDRTPVTAPPNTWSDSTAPTAATVTYVRLASSGATDNLHYLLAEYQGNGSAWRGWIAKTTDDGLSWTWYELRSLATYPAELVSNGTFASDLSNWSGFVPAVVFWDNPGGNGAMKFTWQALDSTHAYQDVTAPGTGTYAITATFTRSIQYPNTNPVILKVAGSTILSWGDGESGTKTATATLTAGTNRVYLECPYQGGADYGWWDDISITGGFGYATAIRPVWTEVDSGHLWLTCWKTDGASPKLVLLKLELSDCSLDTQYELGACTLTQLNAGDYVAYPAIGAATVFVFGRIASAPGLASKQCVIVSDDDGDTWSSVVNGTTDWATGYCGAFAELSGEYLGVRNDSTSKFYKGSGTLTEVSNTGFGVNPGSLTVAADGRIAIASNAAATVKQSSDNGATWTDISTGITSGGSIKALTYV